MGESYSGIHVSLLAAFYTQLGCWCQRTRRSLASHKPFLQVKRVYRSTTRRLRLVIDHSVIWLRHSMLLRPPIYFSKTRSLSLIKISWMSLKKSIRAMALRKQWGKLIIHLVARSHCQTTLKERTTASESGKVQKMVAVCKTRIPQPFWNCQSVSVTGVALLGAQLQLTSQQIDDASASTTSTIIALVCLTKQNPSNDSTCPRYDKLFAPPTRPTKNATS